MNARKGKRERACSGCADLREQLRQAREAADATLAREAAPRSKEAELLREYDADQRARGEATARWVMEGLHQHRLIVVEQDGEFLLALDGGVSDWRRWLPLILAGGIGAWAAARKSSTPADAGGK